MPVMLAIKVKDPERLSCVVRSRWCEASRDRFLAHDDVEVRRVAAVALVFIGTMVSCDCLTVVLRDSDSVVNEMAEDGRWSIWFRAGSAASAVAFCEGVKAMDEGCYEYAATKFEKVVIIAGRGAEGVRRCGCGCRIGR